MVTDQDLNHTNIILIIIIPGTCILLYQLWKVFNKMISAWPPKVIAPQPKNSFHSTKKESFGANTNHCNFNK
jgi:hypothetical protein